LKSEIHKYNPDIGIRQDTLVLQSMFQKDRQEMKRQGELGLIECFYARNGWGGREPIVVLWMQAIKKDDWLKSGLESEQILRLFREEMAFVAKDQEWDAHWRFRITWHAKLNQFECVASRDIGKYSENERSRFV
jgi:hypothetical protein